MRGTRVKLLRKLTMAELALENHHFKDPKILADFKNKFRRIKKAWNKTGLSVSV